MKTHNQTAPDATKTVPPQMAKVATTGPGVVGLVTGTQVNILAKPTGATRPKSGK